MAAPTKWVYVNAPHRKYAHKKTRHVTFAGVTSFIPPPPAVLFFGDEWHF
jgi:hypothetical protein